MYVIYLDQSTIHFFFIIYYKMKFKTNTEKGGEAEEDRGRHGYVSDYERLNIPESTTRVESSVLFGLSYGGSSNNNNPNGSISLLMGTGILDLSIWTIFLVFILLKLMKRIRLMYL